MRLPAWLRALLARRRRPRPPFPEEPADAAVARRIADATRHAHEVARRLEAQVELSRRGWRRERDDADR